MQLCLEGFASGARPNERNVAQHHSRLTMGSFARRSANIKSVSTPALTSSGQLDDSKEESIAHGLHVWLNCNPEDYAKNFERYAQVRLCNLAS